MRPHPFRISRTIYCVGPARLVRELSPLLENAARVRWVADLAALQRSLARDGSMIGAPPTTTSACVVEHANMAQLVMTLEAVRDVAPTSQRIAVVDVCNRDTVQQLIEPQLAHALLYRPFELTEARRATGLPILNREPTFPASPR